MVTNIIRGVITNLNAYVRSVNPDILSSDDDPAVLGNMANTRIAGYQESELEDKIVISLVNISEETSLKNKQNHSFLNDQYIQEQPKVHINLFLLFAANYSNYITAFNQLLHVVEFFQGQKIFNISNVPVPSLSDQNKQTLREVELIFDLHTLSFEQLNDLWGSLGGKQVPFILYRVRLLPIHMRKPLSRGSLISEIDFSSITIQ